MGATVPAAGRNSTLPAPDRLEWVKKAFAEVDAFSSKASDISRNLSFVGIALVLLLGGVAKENFGTGKVVTLPIELVVAGALMFLSLLADVTQYVYGTNAYRSWAQAEENRLKEDESAEPRPGLPLWISANTQRFFICKLVLLFAGYAIIVWHLTQQVSTAELRGLVGDGWQSASDASGIASRSVRVCVER